MKKCMKKGHFFILRLRESKEVPQGQESPGLSSISTLAGTKCQASEGLGCWYGQALEPFMVRPLSIQF